MGPLKKWFEMFSSVSLGLLVYQDVETLHSKHASLLAGSGLAHLLIGDLSQQV